MVASMKFFVLGNHHELSLAEITAITGVSDYQSTSGDVLLLETSLPSIWLQDRLAGTIKVGSIVGELAEWDVEAAADLIEMFVQKEGRIQFGVSVYDAGDAQRTKPIRLASERLGLEVKKRLKAAGHMVRLVTSKEKTLSAVVVATNKLLESGGEFTLIVTADRIYIGQTEAVQDFKGWGDRDYGRPSRDAKSGMLPPKLARMMVNLCGVEPTKSVLLDPFCGSGTVLMEASLLGFTRVIGSDISPKAIQDTKANLAWMVEKGYGEPPATVFVAPAQEIEKFVTEPVDAIATETYLGPALHGKEHPEFLKQNTAMLQELYAQSFSALFRLLRPGGTAVVAFPVFKTGPTPQRVATRQMMEELGYKVTATYPYERAGQHVAREIFVMKKT